MSPITTTVTTVSPTGIPTHVPTTDRRSRATTPPSSQPTNSPTKSPTETPTNSPTEIPTATESPTISPTDLPTQLPVYSLNKSLTSLKIVTSTASLTSQKVKPPVQVFTKTNESEHRLLIGVVVILSITTICEFTATVYLLLRQGCCKRFVCSKI